MAVATQPKVNPANQNTPSPKTQVQTGIAKPKLCTIISASEMIKICGSGTENV